MRGVCTFISSLSGVGLHRNTTCSEHALLICELGESIQECHHCLLESCERIVLLNDIVQ